MFIMIITFQWQYRIITTPHSKIVGYIVSQQCNTGEYNITKAYVCISCLRFLYNNNSYYSNMNALCHIVSLCKDVLMLMMFGIVIKWVQMLQINYP